MTDGRLDGILATVVPRHAPAGRLIVRIDGHLAVDLTAGRLDEPDGPPVTPDTRFDLASLTKVFTGLACLALAERGLFALDDPVRAVLPTLGDRAPGSERITWRALLSHTSGMPATVDLRLAPDRSAARDAVLAVAPVGAPGQAVRYSDVGFMVLGFALESVLGRRLDAIVDELVIGPAGLTRTSYRPEPGPVAPTELCPWRGRRLRGEVHDENAAVLGGVAGHAGLFGSADDVARIGDVLRGAGPAVVGPGVLAEMTRLQAADGEHRRGLAVALWSPDRDASSHPFGPRVFGHTGFTGTSLWVDPDRALVVALLTNHVYRGRVDGGFAAARQSLHRTIVEAADALELRGVEETTP